MKKKRTVGISGKLIIIFLVLFLIAEIVYLVMLIKSGSNLPDTLTERQGYFTDEEILKIEQIIDEDKPFEWCGGELERYSKGERREYEVTWYIPDEFEDLNLTKTSPIGKSWEVVYAGEERINICDWKFC